MAKWHIVTDSSCDLKNIDSELATFEKIPFTIRVGEKEYVDTDTLDVDTLLDDMENTHEVSQTACPSSGMWYDAFTKAECVIAITISKNLSGSYNSASVARDMLLEKYPEKKIIILNTKSAGSGLVLCVMKALDCIKQNMSFEMIETTLLEYVERCQTIFALLSFNNLIKNGRVSKMAGFIAGTLGICGIGVASDEGDIVLKEKKRGTKRIIESFINDMKEHHYQGGKVVICHCKNVELARLIEEKIKAIFGNVTIDTYATGGLCSFYAERHGVIVSYEK